MSDTGIAPQSSQDAGVYLLNGSGNARLANCTATIYQLNVNGGLDRDVNRFRFTASAASALARKHGTPVAPAGKLQVASIGHLTRAVETYGQTVSAGEVITEQQTLDPEDSQDNEILKELVLSDLRRAVDTETYEYRRTSRIVKKEPAFTSEDSAFAGHRTYALSADVTSEGQVLLHVEVGHSIRSLDTIAERFDVGEELPDVSVVHSTKYSRQGTAELGEWSDRRYTDTIPSLGGPLAEFHEGILDEEMRQRHIEQNSRLVTLAYDGDEPDAHHLPHALNLSPDPQTISDSDNEFAALFDRKKALLPDARAQFGQAFINDLSRLPTIGITFDWGPTNEGFRHVSCRETRTDSLLTFNDGATAWSPQKGIPTYGVYDAPDDCRLVVLCPARFEDIQAELPQLIVSSLRDIEAPAGTRVVEYELGDESDYTDVWTDLPDDTSVVLGVVPGKNEIERFPQDDPHNELKRTLMRQGIPSQMVEKSTVQKVLKKQRNPLSSHSELLNILSALVAKAGGTPWQLDGLPGETDAFLGLDVTYDRQSDEHVGASASVVLADGTTFAAESVTKQSGEQFNEKRVAQFIRDLASDLTTHMDIDPSRLCVIRDGKINEDTAAVREQLTGVTPEVDIIGVRKTGQPRIAHFDGTSFNIAEKGQLFISDRRGEAVIAPFGPPEMKQDNNNGTPRTIRVTKDSGPTDIGTLARQAYWLSEMHVGSPARSTRLPIPIAYADKAAKYVSDGFTDAGKVIHGPAYL